MLLNIMARTGRVSHRTREVYLRVATLIVVAFLPSCRQALLAPGPELLAADLREPSGIAFHPARNTLFVVGDEGDIYEMATNGGEINHVVLPGKPDLEGVTVATATGLLYIVEEGRDCILEVDPDSLNVMRVISIPRDYLGSVILAPKGDGLEGIAYLPAQRAQDRDTFVVANQGSHPEIRDRAALIELTLPSVAAGTQPQVATIVRYVPMPMTDLSALCFDAAIETLYVISDENDRLLLCARDGRIQSDQALAGRDQEGLACDAEGRVYIAQDSGGILKLSPYLPRVPHTRASTLVE